MAENPFVLQPNAYKRDLRLVQTYVQDTALFLSKQTGKPLADCVVFVQKQIARNSNSPFAFKDPTVTYLEREENGDRVMKQTPLSHYLGESIRDKELIAPTLTTYHPPHVMRSLLADFIDANVKGRSKAKKEMFQAEKDGNYVLQALKKIEQTGRKLSNNACSGAHVSASTPLYNKTAHATLTSNCRSTSGYGNANNEKFLCGNRHYWSPDIVRNNIVSIIGHTDYAQLEAAMREFGLRAPTVEETLECIKYSSDLYWHASAEHKKFARLISSMTDLERAAFVYTGDLYHLRKYNEEAIKRFVDKLSARVVPTAGELQYLPVEEVKKRFHAFPEDQVFLAFQICTGETRGMKLESLVGKPDVDILYATLVNIFETLNEYFNLIRAFFVTPNVPASLGVFPDSIRRAAITSDTDSTIFTVQEWVIWRGEGKLSFSREACALAATMIFLASQSITHVLARMSANFGIGEERIHQVAMKNEYYFPVFVPTQVAKHYYAIIDVQEGFVKPKPEYEIKGVHLKSSKAPKAVMAEAKKMMQYILNTTYQEKPISIVEAMKWVARVEHGVIDSVKRGSHEYFQKSQIKTPESYKDQADAAPYQQYLLWKEVWAPKYGDIGEPPYTSVKVSVELDSSAKTKEWLASLADRELAARFESYMARTGKKHLGTTFLLPEPIIGAKGMPEEIMQAIGLRKIVLETAKVFYLILETLGQYMLNKKMTRLVSDEISSERAAA